MEDVFRTHHPEGAFTHLLDYPQPVTRHLQDVGRFLWTPVRKLQRCELTRCQVLLSPLRLSKKMHSILRDKREKSENIKAMDGKFYFIYW